jgi:type II secretory pathway component PulM
MRVEAQQMRVDALAVPKLKSAAKPASLAGGLKEMVEQAASAQGLQVTQASPQGNGKLGVTLAVVPFDAWVKWLATLQTQQAIRLDTCRVEALQQTGMVKVQAVLIKQ